MAATGEILLVSVKL